MGHTVHLMGDSPIEKSAPIFVVAPPCSGGDQLTAGLGTSPGVLPLPRNDLAVAGLDRPPAVTGAGHRLEAGAATEERAASIRTWVDRRLDEAIEQPAARVLDSVRILSGMPRNSLRVGFLDAVFPDCRFILVHREPAPALAEAEALWASGSAVTEPDLPGWPGPPWSLPLIPEWATLAEASIPEIAAAQWQAVSRALLDDLEAIPPDRWCLTSYEHLIAKPEDETQRICRFLDLGWHANVAAPIRAAAGRERVNPTQPVRISETTERLGRRFTALTAEPAKPRRNPGAPAEGESPLRSVYTAGFPDLLERMGSSVLVSTYQSGRLICLRRDTAGLNTHFRAFDRPMGIAVSDERLIVGTRSEVFEYRNLPEAAPKLEPAGSHDACYLPRIRHQTGDIAIHDIEVAGGEAWIVATAFSCLATLDGTHSFVPRWKPPFISRLAPGDRCHLNGMTVVGDRPAYVTILGRSDEPGGWRKDKATGGMILEVESGEPVATGISMPHSPRWHRGGLWVLESGRGALCRVDLNTGELETVVEVPGFTRGLAFAGNLALVGLSQIRETATFGGLPIAEKRGELQSGVWAVDIDRGEVIGFLRFEELVQEIFDIAILPGRRFPEIAEPDSTAALNSFDLPAEAATSFSSPSS
ncbi:MAG TPA: TIGR03032 family protein [Solirubrobacterales bacterium]|nr:TIGR03032 family protein [Solirubrobacterales bacterium]